MAPESRCRNPNRAATAAAVVDFPAPAEPSSATTVQRSGSLCGRGRSERLGRSARPGRRSALRARSATRVRRRQKPGKLTSATPGSSTEMSQPGVAPSTPKAIAMRWSWKHSTRPASGRRVPSITSPSGSSSARTPIRRRFTASAARRSDSLTRSSAAPVMRVSPPALAASAARAGISSIIPVTSSPPTSTPRSPLPGAPTRRSPAGSPPALPRTAASTSTPIRASTGSRPVRVGFSPTPRMASGVVPPASAAQTRRNAAAEKSPGTSSSSGASRAGGASSRTVHAPPRHASRTVAPIASSMRSLWSRERRGSRTSTGTPAPTAASRIALLTCALATRPSWRMVRSAPPVTRIGRTPARSRYSTVAPMPRSGPAMRSIGRRDRDSSPRSSTERGCAASAPESSRAPVPLLRRSRGPRGCLHPRSPAPPIRSGVVAGRSRPSMRTPSARRASAVATGSAARGALPTRLSPSAMAPRMSARWVIDLSPGTRIVIPSPRPIASPSP